MMNTMTAYTKDVQHVGLPTTDLDKTIDFYTTIIGFELAGVFRNGDARCAFLRYGHITIESWEVEESVMGDGAWNHMALDCTDIDAAFDNAKALSLDFKDTEVQSIPSFWDKGIRYFNVYGPNREIIEFCQIL
ncbi:MAG: VOC family protein [Bifidobacterium psychraerophilum]